MLDLSNDRRSVLVPGTHLGAATNSSSSLFSYHQTAGCLLMCRKYSLCLSEHALSLVLFLRNSSSLCACSGFVALTGCFLCSNRTSTMSVSLRLAVFGLCVAVVTCAIRCPEDFCSAIDCAVAAGNNAPPCAENQRLNERGTFCGCCRTCVTQLGNVK
jgi:hypothetical protein